MREREREREHGRENSREVTLPLQPDAMNKMALLFSITNPKIEHQTVKSPNLKKSTEHSFPEIFVLIMPCPERIFAAFSPHTKYAFDIY